jgi:predicted metal-binding membrane protein
LFAFFLLRSSTWVALPVLASVLWRCISTRPGLTQGGYSTGISTRPGLTTLGAGLRQWKLYSSGIRQSTIHQCRHPLCCTSGIEYMCLILLLVYVSPIEALLY